MSLTSSNAAAQQGPRPLPLFLALAQQVTAGDPARLDAVLAGLRAYQQAPRLPDPPRPPAIARAGNASLLDYGGSGRPAIFVPSLINPPWILDLAQDNSMLRWLAQHDVHPLLVHWGEATAAEAAMSIDTLILEQLLPLIDSIGETASLVGYCLGGTMALGAAMHRPLRDLILIAAPFRFGAFPAPARAELARLWAAARPAAEALGVLPMEVLQSAFWTLDPERTVTKFEHFGRLSPESRQAQDFVRLEDWANSGPPLTAAAAQQLLQDFFLADTPGRGEWRLGGKRVDPAARACPMLEIVSTTDRIVPAAAASGAGDTLALSLGHVGMVVGGQARTWLWQPLSERLSQLHTS